MVAEFLVICVVGTWGGNAAPSPCIRKILLRLGDHPAKSICQVTGWFPLAQCMTWCLKPLRGCCSAQALVWHCPALACVGKGKMRNGSVTGGGHGLEGPKAFAIWNVDAYAEAAWVALIHVPCSWSTCFSIQWGKGPPGLC